MPVRLAARAVIVEEGRLLLVNAFADGRSDLWCAPGGGVEPGTSLSDSLRREVREETGLAVAVGHPCLVNEFHDPASGFHQVEVFFRCRVARGTLRPDWRDPAAVVTERRFFTRPELAAIRMKPDSLAEVAFSGGIGYYPLEVMVRR